MLPNAFKHTRIQIFCPIFDTSIKRLNSPKYQAQSVVVIGNLRCCLHSGGGGGGRGALGA